MIIEDDTSINFILELSFQMIIEIDNLNIKEWNDKISNVKAKRKRISEYGQLAIEKIYNFNIFLI